MRKVLLKPQEQNIINIGDIAMNAPLFVEKNDLILGMIVQEDEGWMLRFGAVGKTNSWFNTREECAEDAEFDGYNIVTP